EFRRVLFRSNEGNYLKFPQGIKNYIKYCQEENTETNRPYTSRYIGSMVADIHRNLLLGGIFIYPQTATQPLGKLRLMYECNPIAFIIEQAGGKASTGSQRIMQIKPDDLHQRAPAIMGSTAMVEKVLEFISKDS